MEIFTGLGTMEKATYTPLVRVNHFTPQFNPARRKRSDRPAGTLVVNRQAINEEHSEEA